MRHGDFVIPFTKTNWSKNQCRKREPYVVADGNLRKIVAPYSLLIPLGRFKFIDFQLHAEAFDRALFSKNIFQISPGIK